MKAALGVLVAVALLPLLAGLALVGVLSGTPAAAACSTAPSLVTAAAPGAGFTGTDLPIAVAVAQAESGGNPLATHVNADGSTDLGLWQINDRAHPDLIASGDWRDPASNARMAYSVWQAAGGSFTPWVTFATGAYLKYMTPCPAGVAGYVNPLPDPRWQPARTDQGVDYVPTVPLPVLAVGDGIVTYSSTSSGWPGGAFIAYQLTAGSHAGLFVFVAEHLTGLPPVGTVLHAGDPVAVGWPGYPWIETGWAAPQGDSPAVPYNGLPDGTPTAGGLAFARFLNELGRTTAQDPGPGPDRP